MKILKKILSTTLLLAILGTNTLYAYDSQQYKYKSSIDDIYYKSGLYWQDTQAESKLIIEKYKNLAVDQKINKLNSEKELINTKIQNAWDDLTKDKLRITKYYLLIEIDKLNIEKDILKTTKNILDTKLTKSDLEISSKAISDLQNTIKNSWDDLIDTMFSEFKKLTHYQEKGDSIASIELNEQSIWKIKANLDLKNYSVKYSWFDSQINWNISFSWEYLPTIWSWNAMDMKTFFEMISKDTDIYALLKDFDFNVKGIDNEEMNKKLDEMKKSVAETFKDWKYLKLKSDPQVQKFYEGIKKANPETIKAYLSIILSDNMLKAYKKEGNKYYLIPTKYACDTYYKVQNEIWKLNSWYEPNSCTDLVYSKLVYDFTKFNNLYLVVWNDYNILWLSDNENKLNVNLFYTSNEIKKFSMNFMESKNEKFDLVFVNKESLNFSVVNKKEKLLFNSKLNQKNIFTEIDSFMNFKYTKWKMTLKDEKLDWMLVSSDNYSKSWMKMDWVISSTDGFKSMNIMSKGVNKKDKNEFYNFSLNLNNNLFKYSLNLSSNRETINLYWNWEYSKSKFWIIWKFDSSIKSYNYDYSDDYSLGKSDVDNQITTKTNWDFNFSFDQTDNNNNFYFELNWVMNDNDYLKLKIKNTSKRSYENIEIIAPTNFQEIDINDLESTINSQL